MQFLSVSVRTVAAETFLHTLLPICLIGFVLILGHDSFQLSIVLFHRLVHLLTASFHLFTLLFSQFRTAALSVTTSG